VSEEEYKDPRVKIDGGEAVVGVCSYVLGVSYVRVIYSSKWEEDAMLVWLAWKASSRNNRMSVCRVNGLQAMVNHISFQWIVKVSLSVKRRRRRRKTKQSERTICTLEKGKEEECGEKDEAKCGVAKL